VIALNEKTAALVEAAAKKNRAAGAWVAPNPIPQLKIDPKAKP
jgi:hypothetical protein